MPHLPEAIILVLAPFAPLFSARVWLHAQVLLLGAILAPSARTVTAALRVMGLALERHFTNYHRVLNRATWSARQGSRILFGLLLTCFVPLGATIVLGADDTVERRRGQQITAKGAYRDAVRSTKQHVIHCFGLKWVSMMLLVPVPWARTKEECMHGARCPRGKTWLVCVWVLLLSSPVWAATYWVATNGTASSCVNSASDPGPSGSRNSIQAGLACVQGAGDTVIVRGGTYGFFTGIVDDTAGLIQIPGVTGNGWGNPITLKAKDGETVWVRGALDFPHLDLDHYWIVDGINIDGGNEHHRNVVIGGGYVRLMNSEYKYARHTAVAGCGRCCCEFIKLHIHHVDVNDNFELVGACLWDPPAAQCHGFYISPGDNILVDGCDIHHTEGYSITVPYGAQGWTIRNSKFHDSLSGLFQLLVGGNHKIYNNVFYSSVSQAIWFAGEGNELYNNTFYNIPAAAALLQYGSLTAINNIFWQVSSAFVTQSGSLTQSNNLERSIRRKIEAPTPTRGVGRRSPR